MTIEDCEMDAPAGSGLEAKGAIKGSNATSAVMKRCLVVHAESSGINIHSGAQGLITGALSLYQPQLLSLSVCFSSVVLICCSHPLSLTLCLSHCIAHTVSLTLYLSAIMSHSVFPSCAVEPVFSISVVEPVFFSL